MLKFVLMAGALMAASTGAWANEANLRCPAPGSKVERTNLPTITYRGADPASPFICLDQARQPRFLGYWSTQSAFFNAGGKELLSMFAEWRGGPSRLVEIEYFSTDRYANSTTAREQWQILGQERVDVPAGIFSATKVRRIFSIVGTSYTFTETLWIDQASGTPVKSAVDHRNAVMSPDVTNWQATDVITRSSGT